MLQTRYAQLLKASAMLQHLGRAVRGTRAFFIMRNSSDPAQPQIVACHPPLPADALLKAFHVEDLLCAPVLDDDTHQAWVGLASTELLENRELAQEMTSVVAQSIATELRSLALEDCPASARDGVTGLPTRETFVERLDARIQAAETLGAQFALLIVDIDRFHRVTARFGEPGTDALLREVATRVHDLFDPEAVFTARLGGDRFGLLLHHATEAEALAAAEAVHAALRPVVEILDEDIFVSATIGIALGAAGVRPGSLLHDADLALTQAKSQGGDSTMVFRAGMHNLPAFQLLRERDVRRAVQRNEFTVHFQPIVDATHGGLHAFEALLRWRNPEEGLLPPSMFLDVLGATGLIDAVGRRVIRDACAQAARWHALSGALVPVAVNIVPAQLYAPDFCDFIATTLRETGAPAGGLQLELTENALVTDASRARTVLQGLRRLGVAVMIDDFGTGYSSLAYLHILPVTGIKLDRGFSRDICTCDKQREVVRAIVNLAHLMDMTVVAEGIEEAEQLVALRDLNCDLAQGFHFARPFDAEQATGYLARSLARSLAA